MNKLDKRYHEIMGSRTSLINGYKCPKCKNDFRDTSACPHSWTDVSQANDLWLRDYYQGKLK